MCREIADKFFATTRNFAVIYDRTSAHRMDFWTDQRQAVRPEQKLLPINARHSNIRKPTSSFCVPKIGTSMAAHINVNGPF